MEESQETAHGGPEQAQHRSADDILNELFTELGSKNPSDCLESFLGTSSKKKKKHKEKVKKKKKDKEKTEKSPKHKKESKLTKKVKTADAERKETTEADGESSPKKHKLSKKKSENLEDGEITEKSSHKSKKRKHSTSDGTDPRRELDPSASILHDEPSRSKRRHGSSDFKEEPFYSDRSSRRDGDKSTTEYKDIRYRMDYKEEHGHDDRRREEFDSHYSNHEKKYDINFDDRDYSRSLDRNYKKPGERSYSERNYGSRHEGNYDRRESFESRAFDRHSHFDNRQSEGHPQVEHRPRRTYPENEGRGESGHYYRPRRYERRSRSRSRHAEDTIDKAKLLEIARRNATLLLKKGVLPTDIFSKDQIMAIKAGGKSVEELTSYCRRLARNDARDPDDGTLSANEGEHAEHFIHHPFVVKERPMPQITLNIRNAIPLPVRTPQALAIENAVRKSQFPVSSGCQHRYKELEWKEVDPKDDKNDGKKAKTETATKDLIPVGAVLPLVHTAVEEPVVDTLENAKSSSDKDDGISLDPPDLPQVDISSVISARLRAMRTLKDNPESHEAKKELQNSLVEMDQWAQAKALEPKFLTVSELNTGPQAWAKRDQLKNAKEVASGMGMHLLQKMGWRPGEGLGKNKEGTTEPLALDVKTDKKGLSSVADLKIRGVQQNVSMLYDLSGKHPVSALMELCTKRRWGPPVFDLCFEHGPPHQKSFVFKVTVNGVEYQPCIATNNKKLAKANAAAFCLQSLGLLKCGSTPPAAETLQTVQPPVIPTETPSFMVSSHLLQTVPNNPS